MKVSEDRLISISLWRHIVYLVSKHLNPFNWLLCSNMLWNYLFLLFTITFSSTGAINIMLWCKALCYSAIDSELYISFEARLLVIFKRSRCYPLMERLFNFIKFNKCIDRRRNIIYLICFCFTGLGWHTNLGKIHLVVKF